jgi:hypothetical protein
MAEAGLMADEDLIAAPKGCPFGRVSNSTHWDQGQETELDDIRRGTEAANSQGN